MTDLLSELEWRGLLHARTEGTDAALAAGRVAGYVGFDPTADSLHIGSLLPIMALVHLGRAGHRPIALVGGGTGLIGDPSGKSTERPLADRELIAANGARIGRQLAHFGLEVADNADWLVPLDAIGFLRDIGKHFTVNYMLQKDSVRSRMDAGISFTEFAYMLLQSCDFLELHRRQGVTLQLGGSDQWGNITAGIELVRRTTGAEAHGVTVPLVTTATGTKFGKTEAGAVWLDPARTSPYQFYQFWINVDDRDVGRYLRYFTLLPRDAIEALERTAAEHPERREAQRELANDVTTRLHGADAATAAREASELLFGRGDQSAVSTAVLDVLRKEIPYQECRTGESTILDVLVASGSAASKGDARRLIQQGAVSINGTRATPESTAIGDWPLLPGGHLLIKKGSRDYRLVRVDAQ
jgi:tyrosyl-tRNA synthetase